MREGLSLGQLRAFIEVVRLGNVTRAADALFLSQPALSFRLKRLEQDVGARLLSRDHRGARLTDAGAAFLPFAQEMLATVDRAIVAVAASRDGVESEFVVGATHTVTKYVLPPVISQLMESTPNVRVSVRDAPSDQVMLLLLRNDIQIGIGRALQDSEIDCTPLYDEEFVLVVRPSHPLAEWKEILGGDLQDETIVTMFRSSVYNRYFQELTDEKAMPRRVVDVDNADTVKEMVVEMGGVGILPRTAVTNELENGTLRQLPIGRSKAMIHTMAALRLRESSESDACLKFRELLGDRLNDLGLMLQS